MGRPKGAKNLSTRAREEKQKADIAAALKKARAAGRADPRSAMDEIYKALALSEAVTSRLRPRAIEQDMHGNLTIIGGDIDRFGDWFDRWKGCIDSLAKYQLAPIKAMDAPTPPPTPEDIEKGSKVVFGLRVFEGGRPVTPLGQDESEDDDD
jgi:hypothetical protein